ncbi:MAG TPA: hypothetical protein VII43_00030 [Opitutaceae bacterium]
MPNDPQPQAAQGTRKAWPRAAVLAALVVAGVALRWCYLGAPSYHPDETYPVVLIERYRATGDLDMNLANAPIPGAQNTDQYAGSAYHRSVIAWDALVRHTVAWPREGSPDAVLIRTRAFSALMASLALAVFARLAWRQAGFVAAAVAVALAAANPLLIQDAHFARPDSLLLLLTLLYLGLCSAPGAFSLRRAAALGLLLGVLVACKNTMGLLLPLPFLALAARGSLRRESTGVLALYVGATALAFLAAEPESWLHTAKFLTGLHTLSAQYSQPFPAQGPIDGGTTFGMAARYFYATLGAGTALLLAAGIASWVRRGARLALAVWIAPALAFALFFGSRTNFFERSYGTFLPGVFLAAGAGAAAVSTFRRSGAWFAAALAAMAVLPAASVTYVLVSASLSGRAEAIHQLYAHRLRLAAAPVPVINTWLCAPAQLEICLRLAKDIDGPFILAVGDFGDEWTARSLRQLKAALPVTQIAVIRGPFADLPMSSLQCYNGPTFRFLWIGAHAPPPLPVP